MRRASPILLLALLAAPLASAARAAVPGPVFAISAGGAFAPSSGLSEDGGSGGGLAMTAAALWTWADRFRFGASAFGADFGSRIVSVRGLGGSETPQPLGDIETEHRGAWGAGWRIDALGPGAGVWGRPLASLTYAAAWFGADRQGRSITTRSAMAASLMAGWEHPLGTHYALAVAGGPTMLSSDRTEHYLSAHLEWSWRP